MFLLPDEIEQLTGYKRKANQRQQLMHMGIRYYVDRFGKPVVPRDAVSKVVRSERVIDMMPDLDAVRDLENGA